MPPTGERKTNAVKVEPVKGSINLILSDIKTGDEREICPNFKH